MPAALLAPLAVADGSLVVRTDVCGAVSYFQRLRFPQRKRVDRSRGPVAAGFAMTIPHRGRLNRHLELDLAAKAAAFVNFSVAHDPPPDRVMGPGFYLCYQWQVLFVSSIVRIQQESDSIDGHARATAFPSRGTSWSVCG